MNNSNKIYLGDFDLKGDLTPLYLTKHVYSCGWYWGFGYIGNLNLHIHFNYTFLNNGIDTNNTGLLIPSEWFMLCEYMVSAYTLSSAFELYNRGGSHIKSIDSLTFLEDKDNSIRINKDLEKVLDLCWDWINSLNLQDRVLI